MGLDRDPQGEQEDGHAHRAAKLLVPGSTRVEGLVHRAEDSVRGGGAYLRRRLHLG